MLRRLPDASTASCQGSDHVLALAQERDRRQLGNGAIRSALREATDRTWVPTRGQLRQVLVRYVLRP